MILHLTLETPPDLLARSAKQSYARYFRSEKHYVYVLDASVRAVPKELQPYVSYSLVLDTNCQLSARAYEPKLRAIELEKDFQIDERHTLLIAGPCFRRK